MAIRIKFASSIQKIHHKKFKKRFLNSLKLISRQKYGLIGKLQLSVNKK